MVDQRISSLRIQKIKGLLDAEIDFNPKAVTGIFGINGCGKSTILHILDCIYRAENGYGETNYFTRFFKKDGKATWAGSSLEADFLINGTPKSVNYRKSTDRWIPRITERPSRPCYFIGIDVSVPAIEKEIVTKTSITMTAGTPVPNVDAIRSAASTILGRNYEEYGRSKSGSRKYQNVGTGDSIAYTSLSMGAGEQKLFHILELLYNIPEYSLLLIDELDLTLHTIALHRLLDIIVAVATEKHLQVVFTSHREELTKRNDINIRHLWKPQNSKQTLCLNHTTPSCIYRLTRQVKREYEVFVEDLLASTIVRNVLKDNNFLEFVSIYCFGDAANAFSVAAGLEIQKALSVKQLFLLDGDVLRTPEEKKQVMKKRFSGDEVGKDEIRNKACTRIKQFNLPNGEQPEHFLWGILKSTGGELGEYANSLTEGLDDNHKYLADICNIMNEPPSIVYEKVICQVKKHPVWADYIKELTVWINACKQQAGLV